MVIGMKNKQLFLTGCAVLLVLIVTMGCVMPSNTPTPSPKMTTAELASQQLNLAGVQNAQVTSEGSTVTVSYNPTDITYEGQTISDWGTIFGVLSADYPDADTYTIVQLFNGKEMADISASAADVRSLNAGRISVSDFKNRLVFKGVDSTTS